MRLRTLKPTLRTMATGLRAVAMSGSPDSWRNGKTTAERGYGGRWQRARKRHLLEHPLCVMCEDEGRVTAATIVDHIVPHRGSPDLFWNRDNWQSLCKPHHDGEKRRIEQSERAEC